jgi:hypothetical protein
VVTYNQIGLRPNAVKGKEVFMRTLKEQFLEKGKIQPGTMIDVTFINFDNETFINRYVFANKTFYSITDNYDVDTYIEDKEIEDNLEVFTTSYKKASITRIIEPVEYKYLFNNPVVVDLTKAEIEKILGYKINIVKE